jgi:hypothetical protein
MFWGALGGVGVLACAVWFRDICCCIWTKLLLYTNYNTEILIHLFIVYFSYYFLLLLVAPNIAICNRHSKDHSERRRKKIGSVTEV